MFSGRNENPKVSIARSKRNAPTVEAKPRAMSKPDTQRFVSYIVIVLDTLPSVTLTRTPRPIMNRIARISTVWMIAALVGGLLVGTASAQDRGSDEARVSPNATLTQTIGTHQVLVTYGRPFVKGRQIFGDLVPYGEPWRTGANEATYVEFPVDVRVEGEALSAGSYSIYTVPGEDEWTIIFNNNANQWGTQYDSSADELRVTTTPETAPHREMLTFTFHDVSNQSADLVLRWAEVWVPITIEIAE